jgi:hypothetical protein
VWILTLDRTTGPVEILPYWHRDRKRDISC